MNLDALFTAEIGPLLCCWMLPKGKKKTFFPKSWIRSLKFRSQFFSKTSSLVNYRSEKRAKAKPRGEVRCLFYGLIQVVIHSKGIQRLKMDQLKPRLRWIFHHPDHNLTPTKIILQPKFFVGLLIRCDWNKHIQVGNVKKFYNKLVSMSSSYYKIWPLKQ